ncbi:MAG TPA: putative glycoside hydrolase [Desulfuromonadales bacterium]|nr:putative glycoside hydrolase [Desulfuromonadales bacterium]
MISGCVRDATTGAPIAGALVTSGTLVIPTRADGRFDIPAGTAPIKVRAPGYGRTDFAPKQNASVALTRFVPKGLYLSFYGIGDRHLRSQALSLLGDSDLNSLVIDVKGDRGLVPFHCALPALKQSGAQRIITWHHPREMLEKLHRQDVYTIARIVVFKDDVLAAAHPALALRDADGKVWQDGEGLRWVDPFSHQVWNYDISIAEAAARLGFDEIQFDYVRFPDKSGLRFSRPNTRANRTEAITGFLAAARKRLIRYNVFLSADIFGYVCWNQNDTHIGQELAPLAAQLDYISPMLYPSGFTYGLGQLKNPLSNPFEIVFSSLNRARERTGLPAVRFRPWLQAFPDYAFDGRKFGSSEIAAQIRAAEQFGAGWMLWNPRNIYSMDGLGQMEARAKLPDQTLVR